MDFDANDGLTDELAAEIHAELLAGADEAEDVRELATVRPGDEEHVELVAHDAGGEALDVVVRLTREDALALAAALVEATTPA